MTPRRLLSGTPVAIALVGILIGLPVYASPPLAPPGLARAIAAQERHTDTLLQAKGVVGTAVGLTADGKAAVSVLTEFPGVTGLPSSLDGVPVVIQVTGKLYAVHHVCDHQGGPPGSTPFPCETPPADPPQEGEEVDPQSRANRPVPIGMSTGNVGECSAGTIAARVTKGGEVFALSNNHVYALENGAAIGSTILQPGRFDTNCAYDAINDSIGTLYDYEAIIFSQFAHNTVDASIALSSTANLAQATPADGYGLPKSATVAAAIGLAVQKYGRTTRLTKGIITGINATVNVGYSSGTARFDNQIIAEGSKPFLKAGDSGSLLVTDPDRNPVGLLFAANRSGKLAVANSIDLVLGAFGVAIDGE